MNIKMDGVILVDGVGNGPHQEIDIDTDKLSRVAAEQKLYTAWYKIESKVDDIIQQVLDKAYPTAWNSEGDDENE